jgi:hypothetical protein
MGRRGKGRGLGSGKASGKDELPAEANQIIPDDTFTSNLLSPSS